jgi:S-adenosylmethionine synthetase
MTKKPHELIFISQIKRDGSGTKKVFKKDIKHLLENKFAADEDYIITTLSLSNKTYIALGFNSYVVKLNK